MTTTTGDGRRSLADRAIDAVLLFQSDQLIGWVLLREGWEFNHKAV